MTTLADGVYSVLMTPLHEDGSVNSTALAQSADRLIRDGIHGLVVLGSGGELPYLTLDEKKACLDAVGEAAGDRVPVVAGAGAVSTDETIAMARFAEKQGAAALLAPLPIYFHLDFDSVKRHYALLSDAVSTPLIYYHFPEVTHLDLSPEQIAELFTAGNFVGIKDSIFNLNTVRKHRKLLPKSARIFAGTSLMLRPVLGLGGNGCICPLPTVAPEICTDLYDAVKARRRADVEKYERKLFALTGLLKDTPLPVDVTRGILRAVYELGLPMKLGGANHAAFKEALRLAGHPVTARVKAPLPELTDKQRRRVRKTMAAMNLIREHDADQ